MIKPGTLLIVLLALLPLATSSPCSEPDEPLRILQPLLGKSWVGGYVGDGASDVEIALAFEVILDGRAVRYTRTAPALHFEAVTLFYWDPGPGEVRFTSLSTSGTVARGRVTAEDGGLVLRGTDYQTGRTFDYQTILSVDSAGTLTDRFLRQKDGEWIQGHLQKFTAR